jgi:hypothetical protein
MPRPITNDTSAMIDQSRKIDAAIQAAGVDINDPGLVSTIGKHWILDNDLGPNKPINYGWHYTGQGIGGPSVTRSPDGRGGVVNVIQGRGKAHNSAHADYSQNVTLVSRKAVLDGQQVDLDQILTDPNLAPLVSHQGPLRFLRQPGVAELHPQA